MQKLTGNEPAVPVKGADDKFFNCNNEVEYTQWVKQLNPSIGLTIRQKFAESAMQALLSDVEVQRWMQEDPRYDGENFKNVVAINSVEFADALINELNK